MSRLLASEGENAWDREPLRAAIGTRVTIRRGILMSDVRIVAERDADPAAGRIAATSPLGRALIGARRGDVVELRHGDLVEEVRIFAVARDEG